MIFNLLAKTVEQGGWTGACRADYLLRGLVPGIRSVTRLPNLDSDDVVIADNHLATQVPEKIKTIVWHHGCAAAHYGRTHSWRTHSTTHICKMQQFMFTQPNRVYVAPSRWVADAFRDIYKLGQEYQPFIIPPWVETIARCARPETAASGNGKPIVIGDWRDENKGSQIWRAVANRCPDLHFEPLSFKDDAGRRAQYGRAALYLCLSASEGGALAVADAEAAELPIVMTNTGNYLEFADACVIPWQTGRDDPEGIAQAVRKKLREGRRMKSFYEHYTFSDAQQKWRAVLEQAREKHQAVK
ncbi:MAG: hypothetical protein WC322_06320 [Candidatus Paceibacterota bacterium]|jgi:hypothetical protein